MWRITPVTAQRKPTAVASALLFLALTMVAEAHGDLHAQIVAVTAQIEKEPSKAELYLKRGELHRAHDTWTAAAADFDRALELAPKLIQVHLARGRMWLATGHYDDAKTELDRFLTRFPQHAEALASRARVEFQLKRPLAAVRDFSRAIDSSSQPDPDYYLERAQALVAAGTDRIEEAIEGLEAGMAKLGNPVTLGLAAIDLELVRGDFDAALFRIEAIAAISPRKETWLVRRGEVLEMAGRSEEARGAFEEALKAIGKLPSRVRTTKATSTLEERLRSKLQ